MMTGEIEQVLGSNECLIGRATLATKRQGVAQCVVCKRLLQLGIKGDLGLLNVLICFDAHRKSFKSCSHSVRISGGGSSRC